MPQPVPREDGSPSPAFWRTLALFFLTAAGVLVCFYFVHVLLFSIMGAVTLAIMLHAPDTWLRRRVHPAVSALLLVIALCVAVILPGSYVVRGVVRESVTLIHFVQRGGAARHTAILLARHPRLNRAALQLSDLAPDDLGPQIAQRSALLLGHMLRGTVHALTSVVLMLFFLFFLLRDREQACSALAALVPLPRQPTDHLLARLADVIYAVFAGRFLIAGLQGTLAGVAYMLLGVPGSLLWGVLTAVLCLVPAFGGFLVWVPIALYLGLAASWGKALILAVWGLIIIINLDTFLYPVLVGERAHLHTAVIFVSVLGGLALFGLSGFVLGPVLVATTLLLLQAWNECAEVPQED